MRFLRKTYQIKKKTLSKTGPLDDAIREFSFAYPLWVMGYYTMPATNMVSLRVIFGGVFILILVSFPYTLGGFS